MKILMVNKFLYPHGGSETYVLKLGEYIRQSGHTVEYFGMEHEERCVGNGADAYTKKMDFHQNSMLKKCLNSFKTIYSIEARKKIRLVLDHLQPDIIHLNNFNYQLTPAIILEIINWRKAERHLCKIVYTAHDYQLVCPNHMCNNPNTGNNCEKCLDGSFYHCLKGNCIHGSKLKSLVGMSEAYFWKWHRVYRYIDSIVCCSEFMKTKLDYDPILASKTKVLHNFVDDVHWGKETKGEYDNAMKDDYVLYFGRYSREKGVETLLQACKELPEIPFVFAGAGPLESLLQEYPNIKNVGFQTGGELETFIRKARFSVHPSHWYENCPFAIMESLVCGTPVLGSKIGGVPELVKDGYNGELFRSGDALQLKGKIIKLWNSKKLLAAYTANTKNHGYDTLETYYKKIMQIYQS